MIPTKDEWERAARAAREAMEHDELPIGSDGSVTCVDMYREPERVRLAMGIEIGYALALAAERGRTRPL